MNEDQNRAQGPAGNAGTTALMIAQARASESKRPDRLIDDPFAEEFVAAAGAAFPAESEGVRNLLRLRGDYIAIRTRFFDDYLLEACRSGCRQVALLAAGLDARAFRLAWPADVTLFELDLPDVLAFKESVLGTLAASPSCRRVVVPADLREGWPAALLASGFRPGERTAWLLEGILMYMAEEERDRLLDRIGDLSAPGSRLALDQRGVAVPGYDPGPRKLDSAANLQRFWKASKANDVEAARLGVRIPGEQLDPSTTDLAGWLNRRGWRARSYNAVERFAFYGRQVEGPVAEAAAALWMASGGRS